MFTGKKMKHFLGVCSGLDIACSRLSISGSERKQRRAKNKAIQGERAGARGLWNPPNFSLARPPLVVRDSLTEGLEQASLDTILVCFKTVE